MPHTRSKKCTWRHKHPHMHASSSKSMAATKLTKCATRLSDASYTKLFNTRGNAVATMRHRSLCARGASHSSFMQQILFRRSARIAATLAQLHSHNLDCVARTAHAQPAGYTAARCDTSTLLCRNTLGELSACRNWPQHTTRRRAHHTGRQARSTLAAMHHARPCACRHPL